MEASRKMPQGPQLRGVIALLAALWIGAGCGAPQPLEQQWPEGNAIVADTAALRRLLAIAASMEGTHIAQRAKALADVLPDCPRVSARADGDAPLFSSLACFDGGGELAPLERARGDADLAFVLAAGDGLNDRTAGTLRIAPGGDVEALIALPDTLFDDARALALPGAEDAGPPVLNHADELVHARLRPEGGLDIASLVPTESQADQLFRLKSEIFAGTVLDGSWEIAIYLPDPGRPMPRAALAIGFSLRKPAVSAMEGFVSDLRSAWPVQRSDFSVGDATGACLLDLNLLPDLAPCYVATDNALVVGWNPTSVRQALAAPRDGARHPHPAQGLTVDLARFPEADAQLARLTPGTGSFAGVEWPWRRLYAFGERAGDSVRLRVQLLRGPGA